MNSPHPTTVGEQTLLIYDGDCGFCERCAGWIEEHSIAPPYTDTIIRDNKPPTPWLAVMAWQTVELDKLLLTQQEVSERVWVLTRNKHRPGITRVSGAAAIALLLTGCDSRLWRVIGRILQLPGIRALAEVGYKLVARVRHRLPGGSASCRL